MAKDFYGELKLGILGGGQLGRMLIQEAINFNVNVHVLDPDKNAPCRNLSNQFVHGALDDFDTVHAFGKGLDMVTIEIEKVNVDALEKLEEEGVMVYPQSRVIRLIQDKGLQKQFFKQNDIPTAPFQLISSKENLANANIALPYIQKLRKDGYDGRGVKKIVNESDIETAFETPSLVEQWIDFEKELAIIVSRNDNGQLLFKVDPLFDEARRLESRFYIRCVDNFLNSPAIVTVLAKFLDVGQGDVGVRQVFFR